MRKRGFVLVSVLLLCVMLVASATAFAWFVRIQMRSVTQDKVMLQARSVAYTLTQEAARGLRIDGNDYDSLREVWFQRVFLPLRGYGIANLMLTPLDDKLPINKLFLPDGVTLRNELKDTWDKMWGELGRRDLAAKILDFIDKDTKPRLGGYEGERNLNRAPFDMSELLGIDGMTPELLYGTSTSRGIVDYCALWAGNKININVASPQVLALLGGLDDRLASEIVALRTEKEIREIDDLKEIVGFPERAIPSLMNIIGFTSSFFHLKIELISEGSMMVKYFDIIMEKPSGRIVRWEEK